MKDQSGTALQFREVRGERGEGKAGQLYEVIGGGGGESLCERETARNKIQRKLKETKREMCRL